MSNQFPLSLTLTSGLEGTLGQANDLAEVQWEGTVRIKIKSDLCPCMDSALISALPGPRCPQNLAIMGDDALNMTMSLLSIPMSEDCLYLNIYVPSHAYEDSKLPVSGRQGAAGGGRTQSPPLATGGWGGMR